MREATEETGLAGLRIARYLGAAEHDVRPHRNELHIRHFFHLSLVPPDLPEEWYAEERGDGGSAPIRFRLYWLPLIQAHVPSAGQGARLFD